MVYLIILNIFLISLIVLCFLNKFKKWKYRQKMIEEFVDNINVGYYRYRSDNGVILTANKGFLKILELDIKVEDLIGKSISEFLIYSEDEDIIRQKLKESKQLWNYEYSFKTIKGKDKRVFHTSFRSKSIYPGEYIFEVFMQDITEEKNAYEKMKGSQERYEKLFKNSGDMVIVCFLDDMTVQEINPVTAIITGYDLEEMSGKTLENLFHPYHRKKLKDVKQDLLFKGTSEIEAVLVCKDGGYKEVLMSVSLVEIDEESIVTFIIKDVSNIIKDREEQRKRNSELEAFCNAAVEREERIRALTMENKKLESELMVLRDKYGKH